MGWNIYSNSISSNFFVHHPVLNLNANPQTFSHLTGTNLSYEFSPLGEQSDINLTADIIDSNNLVVKTFEENVSHDAGTYTFFWDGKNNQGEMLPDGNYKFRVKAQKGEKIREYTKEISIDVTGPQITYIYPENGSIIEYPEVVILVEFNDPSGINLSECKLYLDGQDITSNCWWTENRVEYWTWVSEGEHVARIILKDITGNTTDYAWNFRMNDIPQIYYFIPENGARDLPSPITIYCWYEDRGSGINPSNCQFILDGEDKTSSSNFTPWDFSYTGEIKKGNHTATLIIMDYAGNQNQLTWQFHIEEISPEITNVYPENGARDLPSPITIYCWYEDRGSGINPSNCQFILDGEDKTSSSNFTPWDFSYTGEIKKGNHTATLIIMDYAGNQNQLTWQFHIEEISPEITNVYPENGSFYYDNIPEITGYFYDSISGIDTTTGVKLIFDGIDVTGNSTITSDTIRYKPSTLQSGQHTYKIIVKDNAENQTEKTNTFTYTPVNTTNTIRYTYDDAGNIIRIDDATGTTYLYYDNANRLIKKQDTKGTEINYTYDQNGNRTSITYKIGTHQKTINYIYNQKNQLIQIQADNGTTTFTYDQTGNLIEKQLPNGIKEVYNYDSMDRMTEISYIGTGKTISYTYDLAGNLITTTDWAGTTTYSYDNIYQLTSITYPDNQTINYTYDQAGNRITENNITYSYNNLNQLISKSDNTTYTYDLNGNLTTKTKENQTTTYNWNAYDKLTSIRQPDGKEIRFVYGADGLRRERIEEGERVNYLLDGLYVICEFCDSGEVLREYVPGVSVSIGGVSYFYHYDKLGSVRFMSDEGGNVVSEYVYDGWGNLVSSSGSVSQPYQYVGREGYYREGELYLLGQRWYDSSVGRFISRDPISYAGGINLYVYVNNNPFTKTDPNGLAWWDPTSWNPTTYCGATKTGPGPVTSCFDYCCKKHDECLAKSGYHWWHIERCEVRACHRELLKCWNMCFILKLLEVQVKMELE